MTILAQGHFIRVLGGAQEGGAHHQDPHHGRHRVPPPQPAAPGGRPVRDITVRTLQTLTTTSHQLFPILFVSRVCWNT